MEAEHGESSERERYLALVEALGHPEAPALPASLGAATPTGDGLDAVLTEAARLGFRAEIRDALAALLAQAHARPELGRTLRELAAQRASAPPSAALAEVAERCLDTSLGKLPSRTAFLALALSQVPAAEARLRARGVDPEMVRATLADLSDWTHHLYALGAGPGLTLELLAWAQHYLRGELLRVGPLQFELRPFAPPICVYRHRSTHHLSAVTVDGRPVDLGRGTLLDEPPPLHGDEWAMALAPGTPVLQMWIPGSATLIDLREVTRTMRAAEALFERLAAETTPVGVIGESWRLDPQVLRFMPSVAGVQDLQLACQLLPSTLGEAQTLRRLFGPDVTRGDLAGLDAARLSPAHRAIVEFLGDRRHELRARMGFVLREELSRMPVWG